VPENIIVLREDIPDSMISDYLANEVKEILQSFPNISPPYKPNLCVAILEKRHGIRCFTESPSFENAPSGSIIDNTVTSRNQYDFYLISNNIKQGTSIPIHYKVIYNTTEFAEGKF
jgi:Piwi domain